MSDTPQYPLPMGVLLAEDRAREQRILEERREQDARILAEDERLQQLELDDLRARLHRPGRMFGGSAA